MIHTSYSFCIRMQLIWSDPIQKAALLEDLRNGAATNRLTCAELSAEICSDVFLRVLLLGGQHKLADLALLGQLQVDAISLNRGRVHNSVRLVDSLLFIY